MLRHPNGYSQARKTLLASALSVLLPLHSCVEEQPDRFAELRSIHLQSPQRVVNFRRTLTADPISIADRQLVISYSSAASPPQISAVESALAAFGGRRVGQIPPIRTYQYEINSTNDLASALSAVEVLPGVWIATPNIIQFELRNPWPVPSSYDVSDGYWYVRGINAIPAWDIYDLSPGLTYPSIGIVDAPVHLFPQLTHNSVTRLALCTNSNYSGSLYFVDHPCSDQSTDYHGTQVATLAAARGDDGIPGVGVSWRSPLVSVDVWGPQRMQSFICRNSMGVSRYGVASTQIVAGIVSAISAGARVVNVSMGIGSCVVDIDCNCIGTYSSLARAETRFAYLPALEYAHRRNALVIFAAGNDGFKEDHFWLPLRSIPIPTANYFLTNGLIVGGTDELDNPACGGQYYLQQRASISDCTGVRQRCACDPCTPLFSRSEMTVEGQVVELAAPGYAVAVAYPDGSNSSIGQGTSYAAPLVSGAAALVMGVNPNLTAPQVKQILLDTARRGGCRQIGRGILDVAAAVRAARATLQDASVPIDASTDASVDAVHDVSSDQSDASVLGRRYGQGKFSRIRPTRDGNFILSGYFDESNLRITKINSSGVVLWERRIPGTSNSSPLYHIAEVSDGYLCAFGGLSFPSGNLLIMKLNFDGTIIWQRTFDPGVRLVDPYAGNSYGSRYSLSSLSDGSFFLSDSYTSFPTDAGLTFGPSLLRFDRNGNLLWSRNLAQRMEVNPFLFHSGILTGDSLLLVGSSRSSGGFASLSTDLSGNLSSYYTGPVEALTQQPVLASDSSLVGFVPVRPVDMPQYGRFYQLSSDGHISSSYIFALDNLGFFDPTYVFSDAISVSSDGYLVVGTFAYRMPSLAVALRFDSSGHLLWNRNYHGSSLNDEQALSVAPTSSGFLIAGRSAGYAWVLPIDRNGNPLN